MMPLHLSDLKRLFYGGGSSAETQFLRDAAATGVTAVDILDVVADGGASVDAGTLAARPAPAAGNSGDLYFATDVSGGTLYRSNGVSWVQVSPGVTEPSAWTPDDLTGLQLFLLADDIAQSDASAVAAWVDRANGWNFTAAGTKQPLFHKSTSARLINGEPTVTFDGANDILVFAGENLLASQAGALFAVLRPQTGTGNDYIVSSGDEGTDTSFWGLRADHTNINYEIAYQENGASIVEAVGPAYVAGTADFISWSSDGTTLRSRKNNAEQSVAVTGGNNGPWIGDVGLVAARDNFSIGGLKRTTETSHENMDLAALVVVDEITDAERGHLASWVRGKYGL